MWGRGFRGTPHLVLSARGRVVNVGRTLTVAQSEVFAETKGEEKLIALLTVTLITVESRNGIRD